MLYCLTNHCFFTVQCCVHLLISTQFFVVFFELILNDSYLFFSSLYSENALKRCKQHIELIANTLQLEGFSRIDAFVNVDSGEVC